MEGGAGRGLWSALLPRWDDGPKTQPVVVVNETVAKRLWPREDAVGRIANINGHDTVVVGVIADVKESDLEGNGGWEMNLPGTQDGPEGPIWWSVRRCRRRRWRAIKGRGNAAGYGSGVTSMAFTNG